MNIIKRYFTLSLFIVCFFYINNALANQSPHLKSLSNHQNLQVLIPQEIDSKSEKNTSNVNNQLLHGLISPQWFFKMMNKYVEYKEIILISENIMNKYNLGSQVTTKIVKTTYKASKNYEINPLTFLAIIDVESKFNPNAKNKNAVGLTQALSTIHKKQFNNRNYFDIEANIDVGAQVFSYCLKKYDGIEIKALKCYHGDKVVNSIPNTYVTRVFAQRKNLTLAMVNN
jgi:soluble lytic murein transglycosylase-like protein